MEKNSKKDKKNKMSDSPFSSPPAPSADSGPPPDNSSGGLAPPPNDPAPPPSPPADSTPPPDSSSPVTPSPEIFSPPPPDSTPPPSPIALPPINLPPVDFTPPPQATNSPPPPPNILASPPPPAASSPQSGPKIPSPPPTKSPPAPPPRNTSQTVPPKSTTPSGPLKSPSRGVPSVPPPPPSSGGYQAKTMVGFAVAGVAIIALIAVVFLVRRKRKRNVDVYTDSQYLPPSNFSIKSDGYVYGQGHSGGPMYHSQQQSNTGNSFGSQRGYAKSGSTLDSAVMGSGQTHFTYEELNDITQGFARQNILGEGGFGCVYKGKLHDGKIVAVKQLKVGSGQGDREFKAEVEIISRVHHRHLVSLVGYCIAEEQRLLIYEYVPNKTLEHHLHGEIFLPLS